MKRRSPGWILLVASLPFAAGAAQETPSEEPAAGDAVAAEEEPADRVGQLAQPGEHHEHLALMVGDWELNVRVWAAPDTEPVDSSGTAEARSILGGRFVQTVFRARLFGQPFEGWAIDGYDNQAEEYVGTWRDTQGTYTLVYRGKCTEDGKVRTMNGTLIDPISGEKLKLRTVVTFEDDDTFTQESFIVLSEEETLKNLQITGRRRSR